MADGKPTLHHMNNSQSQRILWLIEELSIPYNLENHFRQPSGPHFGRAPEELEKTHPMGKAPQLITANGRVIVESSAIASYLIDTYDKEGKFKGDGPDGPNDWIRDESLTSFASSSLGNIMTIQLVLVMAEKHTPFYVRPLIRLMTGALKSAFTMPEIKKQLEHLNEELGEQDYFMGKNPGRADFMMIWPLDVITQYEWIDLAQYPKVKTWHERCKARPAWKEGLNKGNGYDMTSF